MSKISRAEAAAYAELSFHETGHWPPGKLPRRTFREFLRAVLREVITRL